MNMKNVVISLHLVICFISISLSCNAVAKVDSCQNDKCFVSIVSLIANGSDFHGDKIIVQGVFFSEGRDAAIYLDEGSEKFLIDQNGIYLYIKDGGEDMSFLNGKYVIAEGIFNAGERGNSGAFSGGLESIVRIHP
ncbi:hypothetical protein ACJJIE_06460 [Microbulbifer sp. TRSA001]|uniref:hypothetical protein n=1 Tax=Microbulbifer sp. TRSA001 TaxID=3243381 RepID=UPI004039493A